MIKMTRHIKSMTIRSGLITLLLLSVLLPTVRANVSATADSVYFHIKLDTLGILRTGQEVKLTYALVNSQFDSVAAPEFDSSIEVLRGPEPHKSSSYAIINGVESKTNETGFCYFVRFRESGEFQLPPASVKVGNQAYTTPECRVTVHPPEADLSKLQCHLRVAQLKKDFVKYCATLTCNARPDQNPPLLTINGETVRPTSNSYSGSDGKEEYVYKYYFSSNGYNVACKELTFGGIPYSVEPRVSKIDNDVFNLIVFGVVCALFELIWWLAYRYRYREEKDAALADFVLKRKTLPLIIDWAYTHYGASHMLMLVSMISLSVMGIMFYTNGQFVSAFLWFGGVLLLLAYVLYRSQRRKLDFSNIPTTLDKQSIYDKIYNLSVTYDWDVDHYGEDCIVAHTNPSLWHLTWGEQIFIVFDQGQVWVNSVNDLNKRTSICSFGHNKRNIRRIREALTQGAANIHKYIYKLPVLKSVEKELVEDMRLFLVENLWLPNENGQYRLSVIETSSYEHCIKLFGNPKEKKFADNEQGIKVQDITWIIDDVKSELSATYLLIDKKWQLQKYQVRIKEVANNAG